MRDLVCAVGLVLLLEGIPYFIVPRGMKNLIQQIPRFPDATLRWWGLVAMVVGLFLVYLGRR